MAGPKETILVVEDDVAIRTGLELNLRVEGYRVLGAGDSATGLALAREESPDLVLLDLMLPDGSGLDLLKRLRADPNLAEVQVLILTALGLETDKVRGLRLGADDYVTKPFSLGELLARIDAALRRGRVQRQAAVRFGEVEIDPLGVEVRRGGQPVKLTPREFDLLLYLVRHPDRVFTRDQLLVSVWGPSYEGTARTVDNFISSLRNKLEPDPGSPVHIVTVHGVGYRFNP
jgi:two-component system alkaline phosphatase synthesis response regulator PhoP